MKRIYTIILEGQEKEPVLVVAGSFQSAFDYACLLKGNVIAVQAGPEVEIAE